MVPVPNSSMCSWVSNPSNWKGQCGYTRHFMSRRSLSASPSTSFLGDYPAACATSAWMNWVICGYCHGLKLVGGLVGYAGMTPPTHWNFGKEWKLAVQLKNKVPTKWNPFSEYQEGTDTNCTVVSHNMNSIDRCLTHSHLTEPSSPIQGVGESHVRSNMLIFGPLPRRLSFLTNGPTWIMNSLSHLI